MKIKLIKPVDLTGIITPPGKELEVTPEYGAQLIKEGKAEEISITRKIFDRIEKAVEKKPETRNKNKDN